MKQDSNEKPVMSDKAIAIKVAAISPTAATTVFITWLIRNWFGV
jgi:hypothetical protein